MRCEKKFDRGVDRLVIGRKDNENGGIRVNGGKRERERERERERIIAGLAFRWKVAADEDREGSRVAENARMRCTMNGASSYWYRWYARSTVHSVNALPFSIRDVARTTMIARDA